MAERHIVIVGGGFSGTALAIHLASDGAPGLQITLVEPRAEPGRGVAYGTRDPAHRINVPAVRMQLAATEAGDFDRWYRASAGWHADPDARWPDGSVYPQRGWFGAYVGERFAEASARASGRLRHLRDRAVALRDGELITAGGERLRADEVVLAISHPPPALPRALQAIGTHPRLIADPWRDGALENIAADDRIAIIGSGLTMCDTLLTLHRHGHRGPIAVFSRRGLLPRPNLSGSWTPLTLDYPPRNVTRVRTLLRYVREQVAIAAGRQLPWQLVLDDVRLNAQRLWQQLCADEQRRFLRHLRPWWDVHRYRIAPQVSAVLEQMQQSGQLSVTAARTGAVSGETASVRLELLPRRGAPQTLTVDRLIVTTGPAHGTLLQSDALLRQLAADGLIRPDPLGLGVAVSAQSRALDRDGREAEHLYVVGPAARGRFGELMGLPQVADHAYSLAAALRAAPEADGRCCRR